MLHKLKKYFIIVGVLSLLMFVNTQLIPRINTVRESAGLTRNLPLDNAPPQYVLAVNLLGGLRCILVDMLWLRTMKLREEEKYFEMAQLYNWICQLEPQIEEVWAHNAWNMAYNISFEMPYPADRWRWIKKAIYLLRDEGLKYNSRSAKIRREIAWLYSHKIGQHWDEYHWFYKKQLALEMDKLIHNPDDVPAMASLGDIESLIAVQPSLKPIWDIVEKRGIKTRDEFKSLIKTGGLSQFNQDDLDKIGLVLCSQELKEVYKLDVNLMAELMDKFGPLDWRLPDPHAMYWAYTGRQFAEDEYEILYDRLVYISLQSMYRRGRLFLVEQDNDILYITGPDKRFIQPMNALYEELLDSYAGQSSEKHILSSYYYFLSEAVLLLYSSNEREQSERFFAILQDKFPEKTGGQNYMAFVLAKLKSTAKSGHYDYVKSVVFNLIRQAYWNLALNNDDEYTGLIQTAQELVDEYTHIVGNQRRLRLPSVDLIRQQVVTDALNGGFPKALQMSLKEKLASQPER